MVWNVQGKKAAIQVYSPNPEYNALAYDLVRNDNPTPFVARANERREFEAIVDDFLIKWNHPPSSTRDGKAGLGRVVHISGEVGIGKSRLADSFIDLAAQSYEEPRVGVSFLYLHSILFLFLFFAFCLLLSLFIPQSIWFLEQIYRRFILTQCCCFFFFFCFFYFFEHVLVMRRLCSAKVPIMTHIRWLRLFQL
jgi:hypothetical protein